MCDIHSAIVSCCELPVCMLCAAVSCLCATVSCLCAAVCCSHHCRCAAVITVVVLQSSLSSFLPAPPQPPKRLSKYTYTRARAKYKGARANACPPVCVCIIPLCVSQALGKAAECLMRRWKEQEGERATRCVIYICLCM